jgi:septal ring factor EnvC (AmiA/AmiB activator)
MAKENRDCLIILFAALLLSCVWGVLHGQEQPQPGKTQALSPSNGLSSNSSNEHLRTWETLSERFQQTLTEQSTRLQQALTEIGTSKTSLLKLTDLLEQSLQANNDLKNYNQQIGERMQENDEWNAELQDDNVKLESEVKVAKAHCLWNTIIAGVIGIVLGLLIPSVIKLLRAFK